MTTVRVLLVDDSLLARRLISAALNDLGDIEVVGTAGSGAAALAYLSTNDPDAVILDYEMPGMNGVETLRRIREIRAQLPVIIFSGVGEHGVKLTVEALAAGASDFVAKPTADGPGLAKIVSDELAPKLYALCQRNQKHSLRLSLKPIATQQKSPAVPAIAGQVRIVVIASSTGGPSALANLLSLLPAGFAAPIAIVQHMPPVFTRSLAERLDAGCALSVSEAEYGSIIGPGQVCIAPGNYHLTVEATLTGARVALNQDPPENSCRPAADVLFRSAAAQFGSSALAVVLTGMGCDGLEGARAIVRSKGTVLAQDEQSAVVASMPRAVAKAGLTDAIMPVEGIANELISRVMQRASSPERRVRP